MLTKQLARDMQNQSYTYSGMCYEYLEFFNAPFSIFSSAP